MFIFIIKLLFIGFCILLELTVLALVIPLNFRFGADLRDAKKRFYGAVALYFGLLRFDIETEQDILCVYMAISKIRFLVFRKSLKDMSKKKKQKSGEKSKKKSAKKSSSKLNALDWIAVGRRVLPRLMQPVRFRKFDGDLAVGFSNPATTGIFISTYYILKNSINKLKNIKLRPNFQNPGVLGKIEIDGFIHLVQYISTLIFAYKQYKQRLHGKKGGS